jgi:hypothetical protein
MSPHTNAYEVCELLHMRPHTTTAKQQALPIQPVIVNRSQNPFCVVLKEHNAVFFNFFFVQVSLDEYMGVMLDLGWAEPGKVPATVSLSACVLYDLK